MAKKVLTPEEFQAKLEKKAAKRNLFFGTFTKALAFFLAIAIAWSLAAIAFTPSIQGAIVGGTTSGGTDSSSGSGSSGSGSSDPMVDLGGGSSTGNDATTGGNTTTGGDNAGTTSNGPTEADVVKALNDATAKVAGGSYKWTRKCWYTRAIDVGSATGTLNTIIQGVDENADLNSVVGGFLGITGDESDPAWEAPVTKGKFPADRNLPDKYLMKAFKLVEGDIMQYKVDGNNYTVQLNSCHNPQKDNSNALNHVTNDFITLTEVQDGINGALGEGVITVKGCEVDFTSILVSAVIENGALKSVEISYLMDVTALNLTAAFVPITGTGAGKMVCTYSNFS